MLCLAVSAGVLVPFAVRAEEPPAAAPSTASPPSPRYGLFGWLDNRSVYGQYVFPEPFLVDDSDLEINETRFDWRHTQSGDQKNNFARAEVEKGFGLLTLELELPYERNSSGGQVTQGVGNIALGARYPFHQFVSDNGFIDSTLGAALEVGIPVYSAISKNPELVPKVFEDLKLGGHFTVQSVLGYSTLVGGGTDGGLQTFEYGLVFGYSLHHKELPLPDVQQIIPVLELVGDTQMNKADSGHNSLLGNAALRVDLKAIGRIQPRLGVGFIFPVDKASRKDLQWGIITSLVFEY